MNTCEDYWAIVMYSVIQDVPGRDPSTWGSR